MLVNLATGAGKTAILVQAALLSPSNATDWLADSGDLAQAPTPLRVWASRYLGRAPRPTPPTKTCARWASSSWATAAAR